MTMDISAIRALFPALKRDVVYFDNPGGTQISITSLERINRYLVLTNANHGGAFATSRGSDSLVDQARQAAADFLNAARPEEIVFGPNMTSLTFNLSRSLAMHLQRGDKIAVTHLDHDANVAPWLRIAEDRGCEICWVDFHPEDGTLDMESLKAVLTQEPVILAVGYASNALGTINPVREIVELAHAANALVYVDAVQYAPHGAIDVQELGCDFLVCSAYKFYGPHEGVLYGRYDLLDKLTAYRVRPAPETPPGKFETGTGCFENMAGTLGAIEYLESIGETYGQEFHVGLSGKYEGRRLTLKKAAAVIRSYEESLTRQLLTVLASVPGLKLYGISDPEQWQKRVPTFAFRIEGQDPRRIAERLDEAGIYVTDGNYYALEVTRTLGVEDQGGMVRIGAVHYNTIAEIDRLESALHGLA